MDIKKMNSRVIEQFRSGAEIDVHGMSRDRLLLLTTTGRRSGEPRTSPMMFHRAGGRLLVIASAAGADKHPEWFLNLTAEPAVGVEVGDEQFSAQSHVLAGVDRTAVWAVLCAAYPFLAEHARRAAPREIPVVELLR